MSRVETEAKTPAPGGISDWRDRVEPARRRWADKIAIPFWMAVSRIALGLVFAHLVFDLLPEARQQLPGAVLNQGTWIGAFQRWDAAYYLSIAQHGYQAAEAPISAFFPGYPLLVELVHGLTFGVLSYGDSATVVSWSAFVAAAVVLFQLADRLYGRRVAMVATVLFCWTPASLFFLSPYSEALFALEIVLVLSLLERQRFLAAALVAGYASATSPESVALTLGIVAAALLAKQVWPKVVGYAAISGIGLGAYMILLWVRYSNPFEFVAVQKDWLRSEHPPFVGLYRNILAIKDYLVGRGPPTNGLLVTWANKRWIWILDDAALVVATALVVALAWLCVTRWPRPDEQLESDPGVLEPSEARVAAVRAEPSERAPIPLEFVVVAFVMVGIAACTTIAPYAGPNWASSEGEARFVSVVMPLYIGGALVIRRSAALVTFAIGASVVLALVFQALYNLGYWVT